MDLKLAITRAVQISRDFDSSRDGGQSASPMSPPSSAALGEGGATGSGSELFFRCSIISPHVVSPPTLFRDVMLLSSHLLKGTLHIISRVLGMSERFVSSYARRTVMSEQHESKEDIVLYSVPLGNSL